MRPTIPSRKFDLVDPIGIGTGLVEASSSLWKRIAERLSVRFGDLVRWAFDEQTSLVAYPYRVTGQLVLNRRMLGIDGPTKVAEVYVEPLRTVVASEKIQACTLLPFAGLLCEKYLLRRYRAWCPLCLASMLPGGDVYEPLLWRLRDVTLCPVHNIDLVMVCQRCKASRQDVISRFARVGCCNLCGEWMGVEDAALVYRDADDPAARVSRTVVSLLALTDEFKNDGHDGRFTFKKLVTSKEIRDLLASALDVPPQTIATFAGRPRLPRLAVLATIASASRQPLHQVILGRLGPWRGAATPGINTSKGRPRRNWKTIEHEFEILANDPDVFNLKKACEQVNVSMGSARIHFPDLAKRIVQRGKVLRVERAEANRQASLNCVRNAFRTLIKIGSYPSAPRLQKITGVDMRSLGLDCKKLLDEEWARTDGMVIKRKKRSLQK